MRPSVKYGIYGAIIALSVDLLLFLAGWNTNDKIVLYSIFLNILILLLCIFFGIRSESVKSASNFGKNFRIGMQSNLVFTLILVLFTFMYYKVIDKDYMSDKIEERVESAKAYDVSQHDFGETVVAPMTQEEFVDKEREFAEMIYSPYFQTTMKMVGLLIMGTFYCAFFAFLRKRKVI